MIKKVKLTYFPKGTVIHFRGIPCGLLKDTPYYSATYGSEVEELTFLMRIKWALRKILGH